MDIPGAEFVGRAALLRALIARGRTGGLLIVSGDAGIGKSAIVDALIEELPGQTLRGACFPQVSGGLPYSPLVQALRPVRRHAVWQQLSPETRDAVGPLLGLDGADERGQWGRGRLYEAALHLLETLGDEAPLTLVVEDLHWSDEASFDLLQFLVTNLPSARVVVTYRSDEPGLPEWLRTGLHTLDGLAGAHYRLGPLGEDEARTIVTSLRPDADEATIADVVRRAGGNPLYVQELAAVGIDGVPPRLAALVMLRLARLSQGANLLVRMLAAAGRPVPQRVLDHVDEVPPDAPREAADAFLVTAHADGTLAPRHALLGEAVYEALLPAERGQVHRLLAEGLAAAGPMDEDDDHWSVVAYHWEQADLPHLAVGPLVHAARSSRRRFAYAEAARQWERALRMWPGEDEVDGVTRVQALRELARSLRLADEPGRARPLLLAAIDLASDDTERADILEQLAQLEISLGEGDAALAAITKALALAGDDPGVVARTETTYGAVLMNRGDYAGSRAHCEAALAALPEEGYAWERTRVLRILCVDLVNLGAPEEAEKAIRTAVTLARHLSDPEPLLRSVVNHVYVLTAMGRWEEAALAAADGVERARATGLWDAFGADLLAKHADALVDAGRLEEAEILLGRVVESATTPWLREYAELRLAEVEIALGHADRGAERIARVIPDASDAVNVGQQAVARALLALERNLPRGAVEAAQGYLDPQDELVPDPTIGLELIALGLRALRREQSVVALHGRDDDENRRIRETAVALSQYVEELAAQSPLQPCADLRDLCRVEGSTLLGDAQPDDWHKLAEQIESHGTPRIAAYAWTQAAQLQAATQGPSTAAAPVRRAHALLASLGPSRQHDDLLALARQLRVPLGTHTRVPSPRAELPAAAVQAGLTLREVEVLAALREGATNRQIARVLGISERTVGVHVGSVLAKLHARNRTEAVRRAADLGLTQL